MAPLLRTLCIFALTLASSAAFANVEPPAMHDARSTGMGGTGVAYIDSGAAAYHNPAKLDAIDTVSITLGATPFIPTTEAPFSGPGSERTSTSPIVPMFFVGGGVRVADPVTVGLAFYAQSGLGGEFEKVDEAGGENISLNIAVMELSLPVSVRLTDQLSIGVGLQFAYVQQDAATYDATFQGVVKQKMSGFGFPGVHVGLAWQPIPELRLGLTYRSKIVAGLDGDIDLPGVGKVDGTSEWPTTHTLRMGGALSLVDDRLLLALEFKVLLYDESHNTIVTNANVNGQQLPNKLRLDWDNAYSGQFGVEYRFSPLFAARLGYAISTSAVPKETALAFAPPPGLLHAITGGVGFDVGDFELGGAVSYTIAEATLDKASVNGSPGTYKQTGLFMSLSATYRN